MTDDLTPSPRARVLTLARRGEPYGVTELPELLDLIEVESGPGESPVVLICASTPGTGELALARRLRGLAEGCDTALVPLAAPRSAIELTVRVAGAMAPDLPADVLPELVVRLAAAVNCVAVLDSVAGLVSPAPTIGQHFRSWLPGSVFMVSGDAVVSGRDAVRRAWTEAASGAGPVRLAVATDTPALTDYRPLLPAGTEVIAQPAGSPDPYWGARGWLELCWLTEPPTVIADRMLRESCTRCANCGRRTYREICAYCCASARNLQGRAEAAK